MPDHSDIAIGSIDATLRDLRLPVGLVLDYVKLDADGAAVRIDPVGISLKRAALVEVGIGERSLQAFLNLKAPGGLEDFRVHIRGGKVHVEAIKRVLVAVPARAVCSLRVVDETKLYVDVEDVQMLGAGVKDMVQGQLDQMNPIVDLAQLPVKAMIKEIVVDDGQVTLRGTAELSG